MVARYKLSLCDVGFLLLSLIPKSLRAVQRMHVTFFWVIRLALLLNIPYFQFSTNCHGLAVRETRRRKDDASRLSRTLIITWELRRARSPSFSWQTRHPQLVRSASCWRRRFQPMYTSLLRNVFLLLLYNFIELRPRHFHRGRSPYISSQVAAWVRGEGVLSA